MRRQFRKHVGKVIVGTANTMPSAGNASANCVVTESFKDPPRWAGVGFAIALSRHDPQCATTARLMSPVRPKRGAAVPIALRRLPRTVRPSVAMPPATDLRSIPL